MDGVVKRLGTETTERRRNKKKGQLGRGGRRGTDLESANSTGAAQCAPRAARSGAGPARCPDEQPVGAAPGRSHQ